NRVQGLDQFARRHDIGVLRPHVEEVDQMRCPRAVVYGILGHGDAEVVRKCVDDRSTNTSARSAPSNNERVRSRIDKIACEWRTEERARMLLGDQDVLRLRRNVRNELVSLCGYTH